MLWFDLHVVHTVLQLPQVSTHSLGMMSWSILFFQQFRGLAFSLRGPKCSNSTTPFTTLPITSPPVTTWTFACTELVHPHLVQNAQGALIGTGCDLEGVVAVHTTADRLSHRDGGSLWKVLQGPSQCLLLCVVLQPIFSFIIRNLGVILPELGSVTSTFQTCHHALHRCSCYLIIARLKR